MFLDPWEVAKASPTKLKLLIAGLPHLEADPSVTLAFLRPLL